VRRFSAALRPRKSGAEAPHSKTAATPSRKAL
jgi:hypothetical protein